MVSLPELIETLGPHVEYLLPLIVGLIGAGEHYRRTGRLPIGRLPWSAARGVLRELGDKYFGVDRPRGVPALVVDAAPDRVERALRERHYESVDLYSYEYAGERFNLRRPSGLASHPETGDPVPMETHPRGFRTSDDRTLILCHDEASRFEATGEHLAESMLSWSRGWDAVSADLADAGLEFERVESERAADVQVVA